MMIIKSIHKAEREYSVNPNNIYDKLLGLNDADMIYILSY